MRLICPNCDAKYDVADSAFADGGRDVQCSSCAHTWFQSPKPIVLSREVSRVLSTPMPSVVKTKSRDIGGYDSPQGGAMAEGPMHQPTTDAPRHRPVDPQVANILREEAGIVQKVADYSSDTNRVSRGVSPVEVAQTRRRIAQMTEQEGGTAAGTSPTVAAAAAAAAQADPREIPEIAEINAALRARAEAKDEAGLTELEKLEARNRRGFRRGFVVVLLLIAAAVGPYIYAEQIVEMLPQTRDSMAMYVAVMDELRRSLNAALMAVQAGISSLTS